MTFSCSANKMSEAAHKKKNGMSDIYNLQFDAFDDFIISFDFYGLLLLFWCSIEIRCAIVSLLIAPPLSLALTLCCLGSLLRMYWRLCPNCSEKLMEILTIDKERGKQIRVWEWSIREKIKEEKVITPFHISQYQYQIPFPKKLIKKNCMYCYFISVLCAFFFFFSWHG